MAFAGINLDSVLGGWVKLQSVVFVSYSLLSDNELLCFGIFEVLFVLRMKAAMFKGEVEQQFIC